MTRFAAHPDDAAAAATISADPAYVGQIRTTCVATMLDGGHALNALPQSASVNVNCRIFPGTSVASVRDTLVKVIDDPTATVTIAAATAGGEPRLAAAQGRGRRRDRRRARALSRRARSCPACPPAPPTACTSAMPACPAMASMPLSPSRRHVCSWA